jgi:hypothetical protein
MKAPMAAMSSLTEVKVPRRMAWRVMTEKKHSSGNPGALPRRGPLRTGRARFPGSSAQASPKAADRAEVLGWRRSRYDGGSVRV